MPVLNTERRGGTRSALRYRPVDTANQAQPVPAISRARRSRPDARVTAAPGKCRTKWLLPTLGAY